MTKEKLIDYVMTTPSNTNLAVLNSLIDKHDKNVLDKAGGAASWETITTMIRERRTESHSTTHAGHLGMY